MVTKKSRPRLERLFGLAALAAVLLVPAMQVAASPAVPPALQGVMLANEAGAAYAIGPDGCATLARQQLTACFDKGGATFTGASAPAVSLQLTAYGRGNHLTSVKPAVPTIQRNRSSYAHGNLTEWWRVLPMGFEQGFTVAMRPAGDGDLTLELAANRKAALRGKNLGWGKLDYGRLVVTDSEGRVVPATLTHHDGRIRIAVNDAHADYPLTVDPLVWNEQKVVADDVASGDFFSRSVAMSGTTALISSPYATVGGNSYEGAVYVFTESDGVWTQTQKLTPNDGTTDTYFGSAVAIDGTAALIGGPGAGLGGAQGVVYVFTELNGTWSQAQELQASDGVPGDGFGAEVVMDGSTAMASAPRATVSGNYAQGAVYVFTDSGGSWTQSQKLVTSDGTEDNFFGASLVLDGSTALVGEPNLNLQQGAAYVFTESNGSWGQAQKLTASDHAYNAEFGTSVALDGTTAFIGAPGAGIGGVVYVFPESEGVWTQAQELSASDGATGDEFSASIGVAGPTVMIGAPFATRYGKRFEGVVYVFSGSGGSWAQTREFTAQDRGAYKWFGYSLAFNGTVALVGSPYDNYGYGAAYFYSGYCPQGYDEHDGTLAAGGIYSTAPYQAPAGLENGVLGGPGGFQLYAQYSNGGSVRVFLIPGNEVHKLGPAGTYRWDVKAGNTGGAYVLCILHP